MSQLLHIFRKDVRHFWKEILISWCLLGLFVWRCVPQTADGSEYIGFGLIFSGPLAGFLLFLSWWTLLIRLVQDERLVGDRQFWVTRPYRWPLLLAEKLCFAILFVNLPLLIAQSLILRLNGFSIIPYWEGLLGLQGLALGIFVAPVFFLSIVTATFVQVVLAALATLIGFLALSAFAQQVPNSSMQHASSWLDELSSLIMIVAAIAVVLLQYSRRRTLLSRGIILAAALCLTLIAVITPYESLIAKEFPRARPEALKLEIDRTTHSPFHATSSSKLEKKVRVTIPVLLTPSDPAAVLLVNGERIRFRLPNGRQWQSDWEAQWWAVVPGSVPEYMTFRLPRNIYEAAQANPVDLDVETAISIYRRGQSWQLIAQGEDFSAPRLGICAAVAMPTEGLNCRAAMRGGGMMIATVKSSDSTCASSGESGKSIPESITGYFSSFTTGNGAVMSPVVEEMISFSPVAVRPTDERWQLRPRICAGTPMNFSSVELVRRQSNVESLHDVRLADYVIEAPGHGALAIGADVIR